MSKLAKLLRSRFAFAALSAAATALCASLVWSGALEANNYAPSGAGTAKSGFQLRCWQYGKLLFEENHVEFADLKAKTGVELRRTQADRGPLFVLDTANATCLMKAETASDATPTK
jgi:hypothetical protein